MKTGRVASISGSFTGDEHIETCRLCPACGVYTIESYRDCFTPGESGHPMGPFSKREGCTSATRRGFESPRTPGGKRSEKRKGAAARS